MEKVTFWASAGVAVMTAVAASVESRAFRIMAVFIVVFLIVAIRCGPWRQKTTRGLTAP